MKNYRIKEVTYAEQNVRYYPQRKILFLWIDIAECEPYSDGSFDTFEKAKEWLCDYINYPKTRYMEVPDCDTP